ncbi:hypothetical protein BGZ58_011235 [Dissophora ornata]|nr:hypothetical protein BGZ58_011235 [Dissophora ornata]
MFLKKKDNDENTSRKFKSLTIEISSYEVGPDNIPIVYNCGDLPVTVRGRVIFETNYKCKGRDVSIEYSALASVRWTDDRGNSEVSFTSKTQLDEKKFLLKLRHDPSLEGQTEQTEQTSAPTIQQLIAESVVEEDPPSMSYPPPPIPPRKKINAALKNPRSSVLPERYVGEFAIDLDPSHPSSCKTLFGHVTYLIRATLHRDFPSRNVVREQKIWVLNTTLPKPDEEIPIHYPTYWQKYSGLFEGKMPYTCIVPPNPVYLGQSIPVLIKIDPALAEMPTPEEAEQMTRESMWQQILLKKKIKRKKFWTRRLPTFLDLKPEEPIRVQSAIIKMKEYTWLTSDVGRVHVYKEQFLRHNLKSKKGRSDGETTVATEAVVVVGDEVEKGFIEPYPESGQSWRKVVIVKIPEFMKMNTNIRTEALLIQHNFKVLLKIKVGNHPVRELRVESRFP